MCRPLLAASAAVVALAAAGCMTAASRARLWNHDEEKRLRPYGGLKKGAESMEYGLRQVGEPKYGASDFIGLTIMTAIVVVDLPLTAVADTLLLRETLPLWRKWRDAHAGATVAGMGAAVVGHATLAE